MTNLLYVSESLFVYWKYLHHCIQRSVAVAHLADGKFVSDRAD